MVPMTTLINRPVRATGRMTDTWARLTLIAPIAGLIAPALFFSSMTVLGVLSPGYNAVTTAGSNLSLGTYGPVMIANFVVYGLLEMVFARGLWRISSGTRAGRLGARMVGAAGAAFLMAGVFVTDPTAGAVVSVHGALHVAAALTLFFGAWPVAAASFARHFCTQRVLAVGSAATALAVPALFVVTWVNPTIFGLLERIFLGIGFGWLTWLAARLLADTLHSSAVTSKDHRVSEALGAVRDL
jgi:Protein of unknown function (DUF998)